MTEANHRPPEFSRPIQIDNLSVAERSFEIEASEAERQALAERYKILSVDRLTATVRMKVLPGGAMVRVKASFQALVHQACVISLDPVAEELAEEFELTYGPEEDEDSEEIVVDLEMLDPPEPIIGNAIDIGEAVAEHVALALEPFPRAPGAEFETIVVEEPEEQAPKTSPFAALAALKKK